MDKKLKIKIMTIIDPNFNYGNYLQNYAVKTVIDNLAGADAATISFEKPAGKVWKNDIKYLIHRITGFKHAGNKEYWIKYPLNKKKRKKFMKFRDMYINTEPVESCSQLGSDDYYVIGSDQVWNPLWYPYSPLKRDMFLLTFAKPEQKVCFSPSFGLERLPEEWEDWFREHLSKFDMISVREDAGADIVKELTGKKATVLIDPTMMLCADDWRKISKKPKRIDCDRPYILTYFLGEKSKRAEEDLKRLSSENNAVVYNLLDIRDKDMYMADPGEFVYLFEHAKLILTDSFHACVFSFIFDRPFLVYARQDNHGNMMSRLNTLLSKFDLERKYVDSGLDNEVLECDYTNGHNILIEEQKKVDDFLRKSMKL